MSKKFQLVNRIRKETNLVIPDNVRIANIETDEPGRYKWELIDENGNPLMYPVGSFEDVDSLLLSRKIDVLSGKYGSVIFPKQ